MPKKRIIRIDAAQMQKKRLRVAAYCRVSTLLDSQQASIENQRRHYAKVIGEHTDWTLVDIYYEEGVTGTKKEVRPELSRLLQDCRDGKIDLVLTKSISRFARNTTDCLEMVRSLTGLGVHLLFEKENIDTRKMESEFLLTVLSSLAEEESQSISGNTKWTVQKNFQNGTYKYSRAPYGYDLTDGTFVINENEAETVRWIYDKILEGKGTKWIAEELDRKGIPTKQEIEGRGKTSWDPSTVAGIVKNVVYIGDVLMQKTWHDSQFRRHNNFGERNQFYQEGHHEAIIDRETFGLAQGVILQRRKAAGNLMPEGQRHKDPHLNRYCFTGRLFCGECGSPMKRKTGYVKNGKVINWSCGKRDKDKDSCGLKRIREEEIRNAFLTVLNKLKFAPFLLDWYVEETGKEETARNQKQAEQLQEDLKVNTEKRHRLALLLAKGCVEPVFYKQEMAKLEAEAAHLKDRKACLEKEETALREAREFRHFVNMWKGGSFDEDAFERYVEKGIVRNDGKITFVFKCGLELTEELSPGESK